MNKKTEKIKNTMQNGVKKSRKGIFRFLYSRTLVLGVLLAIQFFVLFSIFFVLQSFSKYFYAILLLLSLLVLIEIINNSDNPSYKMAWMIPILVAPVFGTLFYLFTHMQMDTKKLAKSQQSIIYQTKKYLLQDKEVMECLEKQNMRVASTAKYISNYGGFPIYYNNEVEYYSCGEKMFPSMLREMEKAEKFIFLEYFILEEGEMWDKVYSLLKRKQKQGVEIRIMYDGFCGLVQLPLHFHEEVEKNGIKCKVYAPIRPALTTYQNNRDHRKVLVIDGKVGFTGGINIADEYINRKKRFGYWKDTGIMVKGSAVKSFTMMFLQMWNTTEKIHDDYSKYVVKEENFAKLKGNKGYVMPYADSPYNNENIGEQVYFDIIHQATRELYIMTPYLILDHEMMSALTHAAKRGVKVKIIMPHIPDKKYAFYLAHTYYEELIRSGIKIYEFKSGFVHAKVFMADGKKAVVGSINLDYRSLYLHYECGVYVFDHPVIEKIEQDFEETIEKSINVTLRMCKEFPFWQKFAGKILKLFAPLM